MYCFGYCNKYYIIHKNQVSSSIFHHGENTPTDTLLDTLHYKGFDKVLEANGAIRMLDGDSYKIRSQELEKFMRYKKLRNSQMCIEFDDLCYSVRYNRKGIEKTILQNVTGHFEPGKITVIIGPSGAGKTTLLNIVSSTQLINIKGTVTVNGFEPDKRMFRKQVCYVPQQFDLLPYLTTRETLYIAARLKLNVSQNEAIYLIVNDVAESLDLSNCLDTLANKLSNSERKRLCIGMEMITEPSVLLLDEPTNGFGNLVESNQLVNLLRNIARKNCTVVYAIRQPSCQMIARSDNIMVLDRGRCMYCGPKSEILNVYSTAGFTCPKFYNIAEFVLEVVTERRGGDLKNLHKICRDEYEKFRSHNKYNENELTEFGEKYEIDYTSMNSVMPKKSTWQEQKILFLRALIGIKRDNILTKLRLAIHIAYAFFLGILYYNFGGNGDRVTSNIAGIFLFMVTLYFGNAFPTVQTYPTEMTVFLREHLNNWYSLWSYYIVKILTDLLMQILCTSSFLFIAYYMTGQPMEYDRILQMWSICLLIANIGQTVGILTVATIGAKLGVWLLPIISGILVLFSGFLLKLEEISVFLRPFSIANYFRYMFEGLMQTLYLDRPIMPCNIFCYLRLPNKVLSLLLNMPTVSYYMIPIILGSWILCLHIIIYIVFCWRIYYARK